jgi:sorbitol-specific phosphotransferase system component IIA
MLRLVFWQKLTDVSEVFVVSIALIGLKIQTVSTTEMQINFYQTTRRNIPEDSHIHTRGRENLKSHQEGDFFVTMSSCFS